MLSLSNIGVEISAGLREEHFWKRFEDKLKDLINEIKFNIESSTIILHER